MGKFKTFLKIILLMIIVIYSIVVTLGIMSVKGEYSTLHSEYNILVAEYKTLDELYNNYVALNESQANKMDAVFDMFGHQLSGSSVTSVIGDIVVVKLPYISPENASEIVTEYSETLGSLLSTKDYASCLLLFVDNEGTCQIGFSFSKTDGLSYFMKMN